ncbi:MAG: hypothetical protein AB7O73_05695 [Bacteroidia bacterium]
MNKLKKKKEKSTLICVGTGLVALDVIMNGSPKTPLKIFAGGSCGNVMSILSFLSWDSYPIARLKKDNAAKELLSDLQKWKVKVNMISITDDGSTPIIIQRIKKDKNGQPIHRFEFKNPDDGSWLPRYKPVLSADVDSIVQKNVASKVFYFDRINRASIDFAKYYKSKGAIVYFEPSSIGEMRLFEECLKVSDIIKFSSDRINNYSSLFPAQRVPLEIETFGKNGVKFRFSHKLDQKSWSTVPANQVDTFFDAAGAGDWTSAGIITKLGKTGLKGFDSLKRDTVISAIKYGQALGSLNCFFDGARGMMYNLSKKEVDKLVKAIQKSKKPFNLNVRIKMQANRKELKIGSLY